MTPEPPEQGFGFSVGICPRWVQQIVGARCALPRTAIEAMHGLVSDNV